MSPLEILALTVAAGAAGAVNAIAGGGTLITFPVLLFAGVAPVTANATSTLALLLGTVGSIYGYRRQFAAVHLWLRRFLPVSLIGGLIGGILLTRTSNEIFARLVPFLLLFATVLFVAQGAFRRFARSQELPAGLPAKRAIWIAVLFQFAVAIYGGYFGAGIGILMLASLGFIGLTDIHEMNALKTVLSTLINVVAAVWFIASGLIDWPRTAVMTAGALGGYFLGAHYSQRIPQARVRQIITGIGFSISAALFWKQFR
jgi:uncharacterized membrane protein YfcA